MTKKSVKKIEGEKPIKNKKVEEAKNDDKVSIRHTSDEELAEVNQELFNILKGNAPDGTIDLIESGYARNLTFAQAEVLLNLGELIKLPEWKGFWFINIKTYKILVYTKDGEILDTPEEKYKEINDWQVVLADDLTEVITDKLVKFHYDFHKLDKPAFLNAVFDALADGIKIGIKGSKVYLNLVDGKVNKYSADGDYLGIVTFSEMEIIENKEGLFIKK